MQNVERRLERKERNAERMTEQETTLVRRKPGRLIMMYDTLHPPEPPWIWDRDGWRRQDVVGVRQEAHETLTAGSRVLAVGVILP